MRILPRSQQGVTLLEVLIFITILSLIFLGIAYSTVASLRKTDFSKNKILSARYAEELEEWMRGEKEATWSAFVAHSSASPGSTYCFNDSELLWPALGSCDGSYGLFEKFKREATLVGTGTQVSVSILVEWKELGNTYSVPLDTVFSLWE